MISETNFPIVCDAYQTYERARCLGYCHAVALQQVAAAWGTALALEIAAMTLDEETEETEQ